MTETPLAAVVMAGGLGTRMRFAVPKHFHPILGRRMVDWVIETGREAGADPLVVVASPAARDEFADERRDGRGSGAPARHRRRRPLGARRARGPRRRRARALRRHAAADRRAAARARRDAPARAGCGDDPQREPPDPRVYGRIVRGADGNVLRIAEGTDATPEEQAIREINSSIYVFRSDALWPALEQLQPKNVQGELYLTDTIEILVAGGEKVAAHVAPDHRETDGVNTRVELAEAGAALRDRINERHMLAGVTIVDPATTWIDPTVELEADVTLHPFTILRGATSAGRGRDPRRTRSRSTPASARRERRTVLLPSPRNGPRRLTPRRAPSWRSRTRRIGDRTKVPHLSYIGDADIGDGHERRRRRDHRELRAQAGEPKSRTTIGSNVRTAIHNGFVAPVEVGDGAWIAAGSVITQDVPADALGIARPRQENKEGYAARQRDD